MEPAEEVKQFQPVFTVDASNLMAKQRDKSKPIKDLETEANYL